MASIFRRGDRPSFTVKFREGDRWRRRYFRSRVEAEDFAGHLPGILGIGKRIGTPGESLAIVLSGSEVLAARQPIVYVWRRGGEVLYVGLSANGLLRPFSKHHERLHSIQPDDALEVVFCLSLQKACVLEKQLIHALKPTLNRSARGGEAEAKREIWSPSESPPTQ